MAVASLFIATKDLLKTRLRLEGAAVAGALAVIDQSIEDARITFYRRLGAARVAALVAIAYVEAPTTESQVLRSCANSTEVKLVLVDLMRRLPMQFMDGGGNQRQVWNEEHAFAIRQNYEKELARLEQDIEDAFDLLSGSDALGEGTTMRITTIGPTDTPDLPGATVFPSQRRSSTWLNQGG